MKRVDLTPDTSQFRSDAGEGSAPVPRSAACLNCGTPLIGPFSSECGQRDIPPYPTVRELIIDAFWELSGWDGRFISTVRALVRKPGMLTREFLEGRRARYLSPLRLYLLASLAYFVVAAAVPNLNPNGKGDGGPQITVTRGPARVARVTEASLGDEEVSPEEKAAALKDIERAPLLLRPFLVKAVSDPKGFRRGMLEAMPRMLFALLPVFAGIVALFYRGRKYPEHLYFAIHLHAFTFVVLAAAAVFKFTRSIPVAAAAGIVAWLSVPVYATLAFRRVYGGGLGRTLLREAGIGVIYGVTALAAFIFVLYWVSVLG
jgi:hypothetical protein